MKSAGGLLREERPNKKPRLDDRSVSQPVLATQQGEGMGDLPLELWLMILERLNNRADLQSCNRVNKQLHELIDTDYKLWFNLRWPQKGFHFLKDIIDETFSYQRLIILGNGDVVALATDGSFRLLPVMGNEWRSFPGHLNPNNFQTAFPVNNVVGLHHHQFATCAEDGIRIWNSLTGEEVQYLPCQHEHDKPIKLLSANGDVVSASADGSIYLYSSGESIPTKFEFDVEMDRGELKKFFYWGSEIVAEFDKVIVSWNKHGRAPVTRVIKSELQAKLTELIEGYLIDPEMMSSGQILPRDAQSYFNPLNQKFKFKWGFSYWDNKVEVVLNKTFSFLVDIFQPKPPIFIGTRASMHCSHDAQKQYSMMHCFGDNLYRAYFGTGKPDEVMDYPFELEMSEPVRFFCVQPTGKAVFLLDSGEVVVWDIRTDDMTYFPLETPTTAEDDEDFFNYGDSAWKFGMLLSNELIGVHRYGRTLVWNLDDGGLIQDFSLDYQCDPGSMQNVFQMSNYNFLIQRRDEGERDEVGFRVNKKSHVCIYRFFSSPPLPPPPQVEDALSEDFDIMAPSPNR